MSLIDAFQKFNLNEYDDRPLKKIKLSSEILNYKKRKESTDNRPLHP